MLPLASSNMHACSENAALRGVLQVPNMSCTDLQNIAVQAQHQFVRVAQRPNINMYEWCVFSRVVSGSVICEGTSV